MRIPIVLPLLAILVRGTPHGPATTYSKCQKKTGNPLTHCPDGTIFVSADDPSASFTSIQSAIASLPDDTSPATILIGAGIYTEQLNVTRSGPVTLLGQSNRPSKGKKYADFTYGDDPHNEVQIYHYAANHESSFQDNILTGVLTVGPTYNATQVGAGPTGYPAPANTTFGCSDFRAYNIDFRNDWLPYAAGPSHALGVGYANTGFYSCGFYSYQDTLYAGKFANVMLHDSIVAGQVDFLYGFGTLFIDRSTLLMRGCGGGVTAWKGTNKTFENKYGVYVADSELVATNTSVLEEKKSQCSLGRPWNSLHRSIMMNTYLDEAVLPQGYTVWDGSPQNFNNLTTMAVYKTRGPGNDKEAQREGNVTLVWGKEQAKPYLRPVDVFMTREGVQPNIEWLDSIVDTGSSL